MSLSPAPVDEDAVTVVRALHIGHRDHYRLAADILDRSPDRVVLMQRSSSLLLGPEDGWDDEAVFYASALRSVASGTQWHHIATSAGIRRHLRRPGSRFSRRNAAMSELRSLGGTVALGPRDDMAFPVKELPPERAGQDLKIDRQARLLLADFAGAFEAVVVVDIGDQQCSIHQCGPFARDLFELCLEFWTECPPFTWDALLHAHVR